MTSLLLSVRNAEETLLALQTQVGIIDFKDPALGALGALPAAQVQALLRLVAARKLTSATIGDVPMTPDLIVPSALAMAETGVDMVKVGIFTDGKPLACIQALSGLAEKSVNLVAVLMADQQPDLNLVAAIAQAGFKGVMLDTAVKDRSGLLQHLQTEEIQRFVALARQHHLMVGLAGELRHQQVLRLLPLAPDYIGIRGAASRDQDRISCLDVGHIEGLLALLQ